MSRSLAKVRPLLPVVICYAALLTAGLLFPRYWHLVAMLAFYVALGQAFNIFMGMTGYVDFGYVAFAGVGAYGMALVITGMPDAGPAVIPLGLLLAVGLSCLLASAVGAVALRLRGAYFAIATVGVNEGLRYLIEGASLWGGSEGMIYYGQMIKTFGRHQASVLTTFWVDVMVMAIGLVGAVLTFYFMRSKIGYALTALREDEDAAKVMGVNVTRYKITAFIASAALAGTLGAVAWGLKNGFIYPTDAFQIHYTIEAIIIVVLGGAGTLMGPLVGGLVYAIAKYYLMSYLPGFQLLVFAPLIIAVVVMFPEGLVGFVKRKVRGTVFEPYVL